VTKTLVAVDCDPECAAKKAAVALHDRYTADLFDASYAVGETALRDSVDNIDATNARYLGTNTLVALGDTCNRACSIERFAKEYGEGPIKFGEEVEEVINSIKDK
jgi:hypothetical protein